MKIAFFSNSQNRTRKSQGRGLLQLFSVFLFIEIILIVSFFRYETFYEKAFEWMQIALEFFTCGLFSEKIFQKKKDNKEWKNIFVK